MAHKRVIFPLVTLVLIVMAWYAASAFMIAKAIAPPHSTFATIARTAMHPRFQMATPHRNLLKEIKFAIVPSVQACSPPNCTGYESQYSCGGCPIGYCYCPNCTTSGCTVYVCQYTGAKNKICKTATGKTPCTACENDSSSNNCTIVPP